MMNLTDKRKEASADKSRVYRAKQRCKGLFDIAEQMDSLEGAEKCFQNGDNFFLEEHRQWTELSKQLLDEGYSYEEIKRLRAYYKEQIAYVTARERASAKELNLAKTIWRDMLSDDTSLSEDKERIPEKTEERTNIKQPLR